MSRRLAQLARPHEFAFQSAAISSEPWLGPDARKLIEQYADQGQKNVLLCPIGFVCEHVEILYDVDVVYQKLARSLGMHLERIEMLGTAPEMIDGLARLGGMLRRPREFPLREFSAGIYRAFYVVKVVDAVLIFHAFVKKTQKTPDREMDLGKKRLKEML